MDVDRAIKYVTLVNAALTTALLSLYLLATLRSVQPVAVLDVPLTPPPLGVEEVGRAVVSALYAVFKWVVIAVTVLLGVQATLGLARSVLGLVGITVPRGGLNTLVSGIIQLLLIKLLVDAALQYFGYTPAQVDLAEIAGTWLGYAILALSASASAWLAARSLREPALVIKV